MAAEIGYLQSYTDTSDSSSYTFSSVNFGTADSNRYIIIGIASRKSGTTTSISSVTIGGVSATITKQQVNNATNTNVSGIAIANVPTGTSGNIVVTFADTMLRCAITVYRTVGLTSKTAYDSDSSTASAPSVSLDVPTNGFAIGIGLTAASTSATWTGLTEDSDATLESWVTYSSAHRNFESGSTGETMTVTFGNSAEPSACFASWQLSSSTDANSERGLYIRGKNTSSSERGLYVQGASESSEGWYNSLWKYRVKITIDHTKVSSTLTDFPVYVDLSNLSSGFHTNVKSDGGDIRVTRSDGTTECAREVVFYDATNDKGELHFKANSLSSSTDTDFYIYYGNSSASDYATDATYGAENVWTNYFAVYHLQASMLDSTTNDNDLTDGGSSDATGKIGKGRSLSGDYLKTTNSLDLSDTQKVSITYWLNKTNNTGTQLLYEFGPNYNSYTGGFTAYTDTDFWIASRGNVGYNIAKCALPTTGSFIYLAHIRDFSASASLEVIPYINGQAVAYDKSAYNSENTGYFGNRQFFISGRNGESYFTDGIYDEFRISKNVLTSTWISTEYNNQSSPSTFYTAGSQESGATSTSSERNLYLQGKNDSSSERGIYSLGSQTLSTSYFNVEFGLAQTGSSERGLYTKGTISGSSTRQIYTKGVAISSSNRSLYTKGTLGSFSERGIYTKGISTNGSTRQIYTMGSVLDSSTRGLYTKGISTSSSQRDIYSKGIDTTGSERGIYSKGSIQTFSNRTLYTKGVSTNSSQRGIFSIGSIHGWSQRGLYTIGSIAGSSSRNIYLSGIDTKDSERSIYTHGQLASSSERSLYTWGSDKDSSERGLYVRGGIIASSERAIYTLGISGDSSERSLYTRGGSSDASERAIYVTGCIPADSVRGLYTKGTWKPWVDKSVEYDTIYKDEGVVSGSSFNKTIINKTDTFSKRDTSEEGMWVDEKASGINNFTRKL